MGRKMLGKFKALESLMNSWFSMGDEEEILLEQYEELKTTG